MKVNIGKNTLGSGNKMQVDLRTYNRSTHNLSHAWRSTMGVGTLVPCFKELALPGDTFDIQLDAKILTHPTVGPLFGSYKLQIDFFTCPIRLYQALLHNNALNIGMDMSQVLLPRISQNINDKIDQPTKENPWSQIHPSCVLAYLGLRGWGLKSEAVTHTQLAVPLLAYVDIFKNYYANTQEENFYWLGMSSDIAFSMASTLKYDATTGNPTSGSIIINPAGTTTIEEIREAGKAGTYVWGRMVAGFDGEGQPEVQWRDVTEYTYEQMIELGFLYSGDNPANFTLGTTLDTKAPVTAEGLPKRFLKFQLGNTLNVMSGKLEQFDQLREYILANPNGVIFTRSRDNVTDQDDFTYINSLLRSRALTEANTAPLPTAMPGCGLILKTHQSDIFNNWINSEWVDGENGISAVTAIDTSSGEFTIDTLNLAKKVYDMLNRIAVSGGTYRDWINTVYTSNYTLPENR